jgi:hypothetical protein
MSVTSINKILLNHFFNTKDFIFEYMFNRPNLRFVSEFFNLFDFFIGCKPTG